MEPGDGMPDDDTFWLDAHDSGSLQVLVIESPTAAEDTTASAFHLCMALEALSSKPGELIDTTQRAANNMTDGDVADADVIFLADVPRLPDAILRAIEQRVKAGGGLAVFLGPSVDPAFYNERLCARNGTSPSEGALLPVKMGNIIHADSKGRGLARLTDMGRESALLHGSSGAFLDDLSRVGLLAFYDISLSEGGKAAARINGGPPAIVEQTFGRGAVVLFNTTADDRWGNLPRQNCFVPLVDRLLTHLAGGRRRGMFVVGRPVELPLAGADASAPVTITKPSRRTADAVLRNVRGKTILHTDDVDEAGVYRVEYSTASGKRAASFAVQVDRSESLPAAADATTLQAWWSTAEVVTIRPNTETGALGITGGRYRLAPWLVALACLMMLAEMWFVHRMCPAVNPTVASSLIDRHYLPAGGDSESQPQV
jgi:hypothetical protein